MRKQTKLVAAASAAALLAIDKLVEDGDDDPAEYNYYYMQSNGKTCRAGDNSSTKFRTIDGKRYAFDEDGKMLYGWVNENGGKLNGDDWYFFVDDKFIRLYTNNKTLTPKKDDKGNNVNEIDLSDWKEYDYKSNILPAGSDKSISEY